MSGLGSWGDYLSCGAGTDLLLTQKLSNITSNYSDRVELVNRLQSRGWALINIDSSFSSMKEREVLTTWQKTFKFAFDQSDDDKYCAGRFRMENDITVGYKKEGTREFFETRQLLRFGEFEPQFLQLEGYNETVKILFNLLKRVGRHVLTAIAHRIGVDPMVFMDLTDLALSLPTEASCNHSTSIEQLHQSDHTESGEVYSSSILRISSYPPSTQHSTITDPTDNGIAFGAHTDSCFITIGLCAVEAGLEILDLISGEWINVEEGQPSNAALIFVGDFLQVFTKGRFQAAPHRVRSSPSSSSTSRSRDSKLTGAKSGIGDDSPCGEYQERNREEHREDIEVGTVISGPLKGRGVRVSCPFLIRGRHDAVINLQDYDRYKHRIPHAVTDFTLFPDLDGVRMKTLHKMLDIKRKKCANAHENDESNWVLSSFPVQVLERKKNAL